MRHSRCLPENPTPYSPCFSDSLFFIQSHNQQLKGKDFGYRFLWRMVLLAGFATLNAAFFPAGDVLLLFVVVSLVLFIVRKWSDKAILITAILFSLQPIEWFTT